MNKKIYQYKSLWLLWLLVTYLLLGFFYAPRIIKQQLQQQLATQLNMQADITKVDFNPLTFKVQLHQLALTDSKQINWYNSQSTSINFDPLNLFWGEWNFSNLRLNQPQITVKIDESGQMIIPALPDFSTSNETTEPINLSIDNINLDQGRLNIEAGIIKQDFALNLKNIALEHDKFSFADEDNPFKITLTTTADEIVELKGHYNYDQAQIVSSIELKNWQAMTLNQVLPDDLRLNNQSGVIQAKGQVDWQLSQLPLINFSEIEVTDYAAQWQSEIQVKNFNAKLLSVNIDTQKQKINLASISSTQADWQLKWPIASAATLATNSGPPQISDAAEASKWQIAVNSIQIDNWPIELLDQNLVAKLAISLSEFNLAAFNNHSAPFTLTGQVNLPEGGTITIHSEQSLKPLWLESDVTIEALTLQSLAPWITAMSDLVISQGVLNATQKIHVAEAEFTIHGALVLSEAKIQNQQAQDMAVINELNIGATAVSSKDKSITFDQITLDQAHGSIITTDNNSIKLNTPEADKNNTVQSEWVLKVGTIQIKDTSTHLND